MRVNFLFGLLGVLFASLVFFNYIYRFESVASETYYEFSPPEPEKKYINIKTGFEYPPVPPKSKGWDADSLYSLFTDIQGVYGVYVKNIETQKEFDFNADQEFTAASLYKVLVAAAVINEDLDLDLQIEYKEDHYADGTGSIQSEEFGTLYSNDELLNRLLKESDNVAQNMLVQQIPVSTMIRTIQTISPLGADSRLFSEVITTPKEMAGIFEYLYENEQYEYVIEIMKETAFDYRISEGVDRAIDFSHKIGNWPFENSWHDCGIALGDNVLTVCIMSTGADYEEYVRKSVQLGQLLKP